MSDKGIIFSAPMVRSLLDGRKTQTRRIVRPVMRAGVNPDFSQLRAYRHGSAYGDRVWMLHGSEEASEPFKVPYAPGDRLYVREAYAEHTAVRYPSRIQGVVYRADLPDEEPPQTSPITSARLRWVTAPKPWHPSIHMPRWASRLWLEVTDVRVQRVGHMAEADATAEGVYCERKEGWTATGDDWFASPKIAFHHLWNSLHDKPGERWEDNPWVVAVTFEVNRGNIDSVRA